MEATDEGVTFQVNLLMAVCDHDALFEHLITHTSVFSQPTSTYPINKYVPDQQQYKYSGLPASRCSAR
jgi:hypothetical protein